MTRLSLRAFDPILIALVRGAGAGVAALVYLVLSRSRIPDRSQLVRLFAAAIALAVPGDLRRSLDSGRTNRWLSDLRYSGHFGDRSGGSGESANSER